MNRNKKKSWNFLFLSFQIIFDRKKRRWCLHKGPSHSLMKVRLLKLQSCASFFSSLFRHPLSILHLHSLQRAHSTISRGKSSLFFLQEAPKDFYTLCTCTVCMGVEREKEKNVPLSERTPSTQM